MVIGLTGGIATGKTTVAQTLTELGAEIIDADQVAHEEIAPGTGGYQAVVEAFGPAVLDPNGAINRRRLGKMVFGNKEALDRLNGILHPRVIARIAARVDSFRKAAGAGRRALVVVAPLLIESGMTGMVDEVWLVTLDTEEQMRRLMARERFSAADAQARLAAQLPQEEKLKYATRLIDNTGPVEKTRQRVRELWESVFR